MNPKVLCMGYWPKYTVHNLPVVTLRSISRLVICQLKKNDSQTHMTREKVNVSLKRKSKSPKKSLHLIAFWKTCTRPSAGVRNLPSESQSAWLLSVTVQFHKFHNSLSSCNCCQNVWASNVNIFSYCLFPGTTQKCVERASEAPSASALAREEPPQRGQRLLDSSRAQRTQTTWKLLNAPVFGGLALA